nr:MAG TPA: hypothetical protein [Caudoviricetes sp.]
MRLLLFTFIVIFNDFKSKSEFFNFCFIHIDTYLSGYSCRSLWSLIISLPFYRIPFATIEPTTPVQ